MEKIFQYPLISIITVNLNGKDYLGTCLDSIKNLNYPKVDANWLIELVKPVYKDKETVCAGSKVLSMDGKTLDFVGGMVNFEGKGFQIDYGLDRQKDIYDENTYLPFVNGGAMLVNRQVFLDTGGFDEDFFAYYEDVDLGWG